MHNQECEECGAILRELREAWVGYADKRREVWVAAAIEFRTEDDVVRAEELLNSPRLDRARRRKAEHEAFTGHSVVLQGWRIAGSGPRPR